MNPLPVLSILGRVPPAFYLAFALLGWGWWNGHTARVEKANRVKAEAAAVSATETARQQKEQRDEEARRASEQAKVAEAAAAKAEKDRLAAAKDRATADAARAAAGKLLDYVNRSPTQGAGGADPEAGARREAAARLGAVAQECIGRFESLAADAVDAVIRGSKCSGQYEALERKTP